MNEESIGTGFGGFPLFRAAPRIYRCRECGTEQTCQTNHRVDCYPSCLKCKQWIRVGRGASEREIGIPKQTAHEFVRDA